MLADHDVGTLYRRRAMFSVGGAKQWLKTLMQALKPF